MPCFQADSGLLLMVCPEQFLYGMKYTQGIWVPLLWSNHVSLWMRLQQVGPYDLAVPKSPLRIS